MEQNTIRISNSADLCHIEIEGMIGVPEEWQFDQPSSRVATYEKFRDTLSLIADIKSPEVIVDIRSTGGDVNDALLIYDALKGLDAHIVTRCYGYTASAATIIAQAASEGCRMISPNALYLIHKSMCAVEGNADEIEARIDLLRKTDARLAELYAARSGRASDEFSTLMSENNGQGRWLSPEETLTAGLADVITGEAAEVAASAKADDKSAASFLARNWRRLVAAFAGKKSTVPPQGDDLNVLHAPQTIDASQTSDATNISDATNTHTSDAPYMSDAPQTLDAAHKLGATQSDVALGIAFLDGQRNAAPSATRPVEDPATADARRSANRKAYDTDARNIMHSF